jgi:Icc-related predicted phosphoesterase
MFQAVRYFLRILAAADIHGALPVYEWIGEMAAEHRINLLILAGDLFSCDSEDGQREQARRIISILKSTAVPCFYLMGNDDNVALDYEDDSICLPAAGV